MKSRNDKIKTLEENLNDLETKLNEKINLETLLDNDLKIRTNNLIDNNNKIIMNNIYNNLENKENNNSFMNKLTTNCNTAVVNGGSPVVAAAQHQNDYNVLKEECSQLKFRIQAIEDEMKKLLFNDFNFKFQ